ncbi:MAG TPA: prolyl oligopeptidase family serine peptidase [Gemmataceae bacterium]|jgi:predicted peptidase
MRRAKLRLAIELILLLCLLSGAAIFRAWTPEEQSTARPLPTGFLVRSCEASSGDDARYALFVPPDHDPTRPYPLIVFLHGYGDRGNDGRRHLRVGLGRAIRDGLRKGQHFDFLAVFPHGRSGSWVENSDDHELVLAVLDDVEQHYAVDRRRIYLTGLSGGGTGTWQLAAAHPELWAAIVPVCGSADPASAAVIKHIPCWCFHGSADRIVPVKNPRAMIARLQDECGTPRYTEYPGLGHGIWDNVYYSAELYDWLLQQHQE